MLSLPPRHIRTPMLCTFCPSQCPAATLPRTTLPQSLSYSGTVKPYLESQAVRLLVHVCQLQAGQCAQLRQRLREVVPQHHMQGEAP